MTEKKKYTAKEYLDALEEVMNSYDAFLISNKYCPIEKCTHAKEFKILSTIKGEKVQNAIRWIHDLWDCFYRNEELPEDNAFDYLRVRIYLMFPEKYTQQDIDDLLLREPE